MGQRQGMQSAGRSSDQWKMLRKGVCLQLCLCSERRHRLKHRGMRLHEMGSSFFHSGTNSLHLLKTNGLLLPLKRPEEELSSNDGLAKEFIQGMKNVGFIPKP